jgi:hypothetical protein
MLQSTITLPEIRIAEKATGLSILVQASLCLGLPGGFEHLSSGSDLLSAVKEHHLWVARTGACQIIFSLSSHDSPISTDLANHLTECIRSWDVRSQGSFVFGV